MILFLDLSSIILLVRHRNIRKTMADNNRPGFDDIPMSGEFAEDRRHPDGRRQIQLTNDQRRIINRRREVEAAAALFLDLDGHHTWQEIAEELGISLSKLKDISKSVEFEDAYNRLMAEISHDPRYRAVTANIANMLPLATKTLMDLLLDVNTAGGVKLRTVETIYKFAGIQAPDEVMSERKALADFLSQHEVGPPQTIIIPAEYEGALDNYNVEDEVLDREFTELPEVDNSQISDDAD